MQKPTFADVKPRIDTRRDGPATGPDWKGFTPRSRSRSAASHMSSGARGISVAASRTLVESPPSTSKASPFEEKFLAALPPYEEVIHSRLLKLLERQMKGKAAQSEPTASLSSDKEYYTIVCPLSSDLILACCEIEHGPRTSQTESHENNERIRFEWYNLTARSRNERTTNIRNVYRFRSPPLQRTRLRVANCIKGETVALREKT